MGHCISKNNEKKQRRNTLILKKITLPEISEVTEVQRIPTNKSLSMIKDSLKHHPLFTKLNEDDLTLIKKTIAFYEVAAYKTIFKQGEKGQYFYIVESGKLEVIRSEVKKTILQRGDHFGEMSLLTDCSRRATINTIEETQLWGIHKQTFIEVIRNINLRCFEVNKQFLSGLKMFANMPNSVLDRLALALFVQEFEDSVRIICEGDEGILLFIIKQGQAIVKVQGVEKFRLIEGEMFGESSVLGLNKINKFSVYSVGSVTVLSLSIRSIQNILGDDFKDILYKNQAKNSLLSNRYIKLLSRENIEKIIENLEWKIVKDEEDALGNPFDIQMVYVIAYGTLTCGDIVFSHHDVIGFMNSKSVVASMQSVLRSKGEVILGVISISNIEFLLNMHLTEIKKQLKIVNILKKLEFFNKLSQSKLRFIADATVYEKYENKEIIFEFNDEAKSFFVIISGSVKIYESGKVIRILGKYDIFGDNCLQEKTRSTNAKALKNCKCLVIQQSCFQTVLEDNRQINYLRTKSYLSSFTLNELIFLKLIRKVDQRNTFMTFTKRNNLIYYVEVIEKESIHTLKTFEDLLHEKNIAISVEHLLILRLIKTFCDTNFVYMVYENFQVIPFESILREKLTEDQAKFLTAALLTILEYLHDKSIIYREFNPGALTINSEGYPFISSLRSAKIVKNRTKTVIGDFAYSAPELILGKSYDKAVNYWSLGVMIYQFLYNTLPFDIQNIDNPLIIVERIMNAKLQFPSDSKYIRANELITRLLNTDSKERGGLDEVKYSRWLDSVDWQRVSTNTFESPIKTTVPAQKAPKEKDCISLTRYLHEIFLEQVNNNNKPYKQRKKLNWKKFF